MPPRLALADEPTGSSDATSSERPDTDDDQAAMTPGDDATDRDESPAESDLEGGDKSSQSEDSVTTTERSREDKDAETDDAETDNSKTDRPRTDRQCEEAPSIRRPVLRALRFEENWRWTPCFETDDFFDPIKHIAFTHDPSDALYLSLGGSVRGRGLAWSGYRFGAPEQPNAIYGLGQFRAHADMHLTSWARIYVEGLSSLSSERNLPGDRRPEDHNPLALLNAFGDFAIDFGSLGELRIRGGRQEIALGAGRLISPDPWTNSRQTFDGGRLLMTLAGWSLDALLVMPVEIDPDAFDESSTDRVLGGVSVTSQRSRPETTGGAELQGQLYWLVLHEEETTFGGVPGAHTRHTVGGRFSGVLPTGVDIDLEGAMQSGTHAERDIDAWFATMVVGLDVDALLTPRFEIGADLSSGDGRVFDGEVNTFDPHFYNRHAALGISDQFGRANIFASHLLIGLDPTEGLHFDLVGRVFHLAARSDLLYDGALTPYRASGDDTPRGVGGELDVTLDYRFDAHASAALGYAHLFAGTFIEATGAASDADFGYVQYEYAF